MQFGKVAQPELIDFTLPIDAPETLGVLSQSGDTPLSVYVGCAKWNRQDLKGFYPRGIKDELHYYARQFNAIEMNATYYRIFAAEQFKKWYDKTPAGFKFFPKLVQDISHFQRLGEGVFPLVDRYLESVIHLQEKLGTIFLQLHSNFDPEHMDRVARFAAYWPKEIPLAIEFRHTDWFNDVVVATELYDVLETHGITNVITDTAGRRDLLHMRLTTKEAFVRYVGANHETDYSRLDDWIARLRLWKEQGIESIHFFVHQNVEEASPLLSNYLVKGVNKKLGVSLKLSRHHEQDTPTLF